jgi:hypothetical protein
LEVAANAALVEAPGPIDIFIFDAAAFARVVAKGVGDGRAAAATRTSARADAPAAAATAALVAFATAANAASARDAPDVVSAYLDLSPSASELFAPLWLGAVRPAATSAALDCLLAVAYYANPPRAIPYNGPVIRPLASVIRAKSVVKDVVKGRSAAVYDVLSRNGSTSASIIANKALLLLAHVAHRPYATRPLASPARRFAN